MDKTPQGPNPGLLYVLSKIVKPDQLPAEEFKKWYEDVHIRDILKVPGMEEAYRWENVDPTAERQYLASYPVGDLSTLETQAFKDIPVEDESLPGSHQIFDFANFDIRVYKYAQLYEPESPKKSGQADWLVSAAFTPADDADYDKWYREEHLKDVSRVVGWRKTERYDLVSVRENRRPAEERSFDEPPKYVTMHFFDGETLPAEELAKLAESEWTKKNMSSMKKQEIGLFKKLSAFSK